MSSAASQRIDLLGLPLDPAADINAVRRLVRQKNVLRLVTFLDPNSWAFAKRHPECLEALQKTTLNLTSSAEVAWACSWIRDVPCTPLRFGTEAFSDSFFRDAVAENASFILVGGRPGIDEAMQERLQHRYAGIEILKTFHGYGEFEPKIAEILSLSPDIVLIDMGSPRQEIFLLTLSKTKYRGLAITCKGYFERHHDKGGWHPAWVGRWNAHFIWNFCREYRVSSKRYLSDYRFFVTQTIKALGEKYKARLYRRS